MHRIKTFISKFSFSRRLAFAFFLCALITFTVIDIIMNILYAQIVTSTNSDSTFNTKAFSQFSNNQILSSTQAYLQSGLDLYEQIMSETYTTYFHFKQNPDIYESRQQRGIRPKLSSSYQNPKYDRSCVYFFSENSTFYDHPYLDKLISSSATQHYPSSLKRINIIYQSKTKPQDIMVRTVPSTNDFYIPNSEIITQRIKQSISGQITFSDWYYDQFSLSDNQTQIIALRVLIEDQIDYKMLIQIEVRKFILDYALTNIYSFPSTKVALLKIIQEGYSIQGLSTNLPPSVDVSQFLQPGQSLISIQNTPFLVTTHTLIDDNNDINEKFSQQTDLRLIIFLNKTETQRPNIIYQQFSKKQYSTLIFLLYGWSFVVLLFVFFVGVVVGDIIFSYFSLIRKKCKQYLYNPQQTNQIDTELKQKYDSQLKNRELYQNITSIIQGIQNKKLQNRKNYIIKYDQFPINRMGMDFQKRMNIKDYNKLQAIAKIIKQRQENF